MDIYWKTTEMRSLVGRKIPTWSVERGSMSREFTVHGVDSRAISIVPCNDSGVLKVYRYDFERVAERWADYLARKVSRTALCRISQRTTYILSLLYWLSGRGSVSVMRPNEWKMAAQGEK